MFEHKDLPLEQIKVIDRARKNFGDMTTLKEEIKEHGLLISILVNEDYQLIDGGRRLKAHQELKLPTVRCQIIPGISGDDVKVLERITNTARKDFDWHEELEIKHSLHVSWKEADPNWSYRKTAKRLKCSSSGISSDLALAEAIKVIPKLKDCKTKSKARDSYKKMQAQAESMQAIDGISEEEKARLTKMLSGDTDMEAVLSAKPKAEKSMPCVTKQAPDMREMAGYDPTPTTPQHTNTRVSENVHSSKEAESSADVSLPDHAYEVTSNQIFIKKIPDNTVGFCELDPPYAIDFNNTYGGLGGNKTTDQDWTVEQLKDFMNEFLPTLHSKLLDNSWVICWTGKEHWMWTNEIAESHGFHTQMPGIWAKPSGSSNTPSTNMVSTYEMFLLFRKGKAQFNIPSFPSVINFNSPPASQRQHSWEKPMDMYDWLFKALGKPGSIFLSPFAGSGNSMVSAALNGMTPCGCDTNKKYFYQFYANLKKHFDKG